MRQLHVSLFVSTVPDGVLLRFASIREHRMVQSDQRQGIRTHARPLSDTLTPNEILSTASGQRKIPNEYATPEPSAKAC
jgi:hypothetical protein